MPNLKVYKEIFCIDRPTANNYNEAMITRMKRLKKDRTIMFRLPSIVVDAIDREADRDGLPRSYIIRRLVLERFPIPNHASATPDVQTKTH